MAEPTPNGGVLIVRRSWDRRGLAPFLRSGCWLSAAAVLAVVWLIAELVHEAALQGSAAWIAAAFAALGVMVAVQERTRLYVDGDVFGETRWPGRRTAHRTADAGGIRRVTKKPLNQPALPHLVVLDHQGRRLLDIRTDVWAGPDLDTFVTRLGITPQGSFDHVVDGGEFDRLFPKR